MAFTEFGSGDVQAVKRWSQKLFRETMGKTYFKRFMGKGDDAIIKMLMDLESAPGDTIKYDLRTRNRSNGVQGDARLKGFEQALTFLPDQIEVDQLRNAHAFKKMSQQRTVHDLRKEGRASLSDWYAWVFDSMMCAYLSGVAGDGNESVSGILGASGFAGNALTAPDADHEVDATGSAFDLDQFDDAIAKAAVSNPRLKPTMVNGQPKFVALLHPYSIRSLKNSVGSDRWTSIHRDASPRGTSNPIYTGASGEYNNVVIHSSEFVTRSGNLTYNLLLGGCAGVTAFGNAYDKMDQSSAGGGSHFSYHEELEDYGNEKGIGVASCFGMKKTTFGGEDYGVIRITNTEVPPA